MILYNKEHKKIKGFTLAEAMIFLLIATLIMIAAMPVITRKYQPPVRQIHGKWACKLIGGQLYSTILGDSDEPLPDDSFWTAGCTFPKLPSSVKSALVTVVGGGAAGTMGNVTIDYSGTPKTLFNACEGKSYNNVECSEEARTYKVESDGMYEITFNGTSGIPATLYNVDTNAGQYAISIWNPDTHDHKQTCEFERSTGNQRIPSVKFEIRLNTNDKLKLVYTSNIKYRYTGDMYGVKRNGTNITPFYFCDYTKPGKIDYVDDMGMSHTIDYYFAKINQTVGNGGVSKELYLIKNDGSEHKLITVHGSAGSYYSSSQELCMEGQNVACTSRFHPNDVDNPYGSSPSSAYVLGWLPASNIISAEIKDIGKSGVLKSTAELKQPSIKMVGGEGGAAGQVETSVLLTRHLNMGNYPIIIGRGGSGAGLAGQDTTFAQITAVGGKGSYIDTGATNGAQGHSGQPAPLATAGDSVGGVGGGGGAFKTSDMPQMSFFDGKNGIGIGAGGGGGGTGYDIGNSNTLGDYVTDVILPAMQTHSVVNVINNNKKIGSPGWGSSGGVIVTW